MSEISTKPYLLRAIYEWCTDNGFTPYIAVAVDGRTQVPREFVKNGEIVLNISFEATSGLKIDNDLIHFHARFGGVSRELYVPVENVMAIYARENGQGMAFDVDKAALQSRDKLASVDDKPAESTVLSAVPSKEEGDASASADGKPEDDPEPPKKGGRPTLTVIK